MKDKASGNKNHIRSHLPIYPKAFIASARLSKERDRVFVEMPFEAQHSDSIWKIIRAVCDIHGLIAHRADSSVYPNPIVTDILEEIERSEIIIADLTGMNPNVLYELGIAHVRCDSVILLCDKNQKLPFDLASLRCIFYDLSMREGSVELAENLGRTLNALKSVGPPIIINSVLDRTKLITTDLQVLASLPDEELSNRTVWFSGFLSSLAITSDEEYPPEEKEYRIALSGEIESLLTLARRGCLIRCIITPPSEYDLVIDRVDYACCRLRGLLSFLESNDQALKNIEWAVSPFRQKNVYIIDRISYFEGYKKGIQSGYGLTLRLSALDAISANISLYEVLFERLATYTLTKYGEPEEEHREALRRATINCLKQSLEFCLSKRQETANSLERHSKGRA